MKQNTQNTMLMMSHSLTHLPPAHQPPSHIHCFTPGSKLTFSTNLFHHSLLAPTWTAFSDYTGPDLLCSTVFHFQFVFFFFVSCGRLSWLNCQLSSTRLYSIFTYLLTYLLIYLRRSGSEPIQECVKRFARAKALRTRPVPRMKMIYCLREYESFENPYTILDFRVFVFSFNCPHVLY